MLFEKVSQLMAFLQINVKAIADLLFKYILGV